MSVFAGLCSGVLFGIGLALSGMTQPAKVLGFLDVAGNWDPSLSLVMAGAIAVYAPLFRFIVRETKPRYVQQFVVFAGQQLDTPLLLGAAVFGVGWGLAGFCPGPALVSAGTGASQGVVFALSMLAGMLVFAGYDRVLESLRTRSGGDQGAVRSR